MYNADTTERYDSDTSVNMRMALECFLSNVYDLWVSYIKNDTNLYDSNSQRYWKQQVWKLERQYFRAYDYHDGRNFHVGAVDW